MITIDGKEYRTLEEQVKWLTENMATGKTVNSVNIGKPTLVTYDSDDGALCTATATITFSDATTDTCTVNYYVPIIPGDNITIDADETDTHVVIKANSGSGATIYRHAIHMQDSAQSGSELFFVLYSTRTASYTEGTVVTAIGTSMMPATGLRTDGENDHPFTTVFVSSGSLYAYYINDSGALESEDLGGYDTFEDTVSSI